MRWHVKAQIECSCPNCPERANGEVTLRHGFMGDLQVDGFVLEVGWTFVKGDLGGLCPKHSETTESRSELLKGNAKAEERGIARGTALADFTKRVQAGSEGSTR